MIPESFFRIWQGVALFVLGALTQSALQFYNSEPENLRQSWVLWARDYAGLTAEQFRWVWVLLALLYSCAAGILLGMDACRAKLNQQLEDLYEKTNPSDEAGCTETSGTHQETGEADRPDSGSSDSLEHTGVPRQLAQKLGPRYARFARP